ncbi:MAG TPA: 50S ribosomal protein L3 N(5)-glutamine methyltransferase [Casimicrobiaceae bacterium]|jgi:ribosomal protein L3 glutamine methyltransferase|nr:50S ribosomal protein L3 N(5)-glutamine methyltransferase [Casimicrobiaceae bacterium]
MSTLTQELETFRDWLRYAVSRFNVTGLSYGHGMTTAYDEAAYLLLHTLHLPLDRLEPFLDAKLTHVEREEVQDIIARRVNERIPAAYLTHEAWLGEYRFYVDERVLIPRSYIAELLREGLSPWIPEPDRIQTALDLCTGSGCLAILVAHHFPNADVDAADISSDALAVALHNVADHGLQGRVNLIRSDLLSNLTEKNYDLIVCNPPYVTAMAMEELPPEYRHEPQLALAGGDDGLDAVRTILARAAEFLNPDGLLVVEVGQNRAAAEAAFPRLPFTWLSTESSDEAVFLLRHDELLAANRAAA